jgi:putative transposase
MTPYPSDLTDAQWNVLEPLMPIVALGRPRTHALRTIVNAVFYVLRGGIAWRSLPHEYPPWQTVYYHFRCWRIANLWETVNTTLREQVRVQQGRHVTPSAAIIDSQTVRTCEQGGTRGFDGGKRINGRKRHILVDTNGLLLIVKVHAANILDRVGGRLLLEDIEHTFPTVRHLWADAAYNGSFLAWTRGVLGLSVQVVKRPSRWVRCAPGQEPPPYPSGFIVLPRRWVVERTFAWLGRNRRLTKDFEGLPSTTETWCYLGMSRLMLRRLARP